MEFLNRSIANIKTQLGNLRWSQRMVIGLLLVIMIAAIYWMVNYSARQEMIPLLNQSFTKDEIAPIINTLDHWDIEYRIERDKIMVPRSEQRELLYRLYGEEVLPEDTTIGWNYLIEDTNMLVPEAVREDKRLVVRQIMLAEAISTWPGVDKVSVIINAGDKRTLNRFRPGASASVTVKMRRSGTGTRKLANAIADFLASANNRMKRDNVTVVIDGVKFPVNAQGQGLNSEYLEEKANYERLYRDKIIAGLPIPNLLVQVNADPKLTRVETETHRIFNDGEGSWNPIVDKTTREDSSTNRSASSEAGVMANVGQTPTPSGSENSEKSEDGTQTSNPIPGSQTKHEITGLGGVTNITATVQAPWEYFAEIVKREFGSDTDPDPEKVKEIFEREKPLIRDSVMRICGLTADQEDNVVVNYYWAAGFASGSGGVGGAAGGSGDAAEGTGDVTAAESSFSAMAKGHAKQIAVGALAMVSLFMMLMMVRRASSPTVIDEEEASQLIAATKAPEAMGIEEGDDESAGGLLAGVEVDDDTVRSRQVLGQIREMVEERPESAATLLRKWIAEDI